MKVLLACAIGAALAWHAPAPAQRSCADAVRQAPSPAHQRTGIPIARTAAAGEVNEDALLQTEAALSAFVVAEVRSFAIEAMQAEDEAMATLHKRKPWLKPQSDEAKAEALAYQEYGA